MEEFGADEKVAYNKIKQSRTLEEAVVGMASYERYGGWNSSSTYNQLLSLKETGNRIGYAADLLQRIKNGDFK